MLTMLSALIMQLLLVVPVLLLLSSGCVGEADSGRGELFRDEYAEEPCRFTSPMSCDRDS